jgi:hypothetical protein
MVPAEDLQLSVLSPCVLSGKADAARIVRTLLSAPSAVPTKYGYWEPLRSPFKMDQLESVLERWPSDLLWKRDRPRVSGSFFWSGDKDGTTVEVSAGQQDSLVTELTGLLQRWAVQLRADFGLLHVLTAADIRVGVQSGAVQHLDKEGRRSVLTVFRRHLRRYCPNLYWATIVGPPYVELFGRERVRSLPAYQVEELAPDLFYVQLTEQIGDVRERPGEFEAARDRAKAHLGGDAFFEVALGRDHGYRVPQFQLLTGLPDST